MKKRNIKITKQMVADAKTMLKLMGLPVVEAFSEAEAQCVVLVRDKKADAVASEDMDCLTFGATLQLRGFTQRKSKNDPITEIELDMVLKELELTMDEFIDFCIMCGCDYTKTIDGLGPSGAFKLIKEYKTIEKSIEALKEKNVEREKAGKPPMYNIPDGERFNYEAARAEFKACKAFPSEEIEV
jgi:flap endonuclease-1